MRSYYRDKRKGQLLQHGAIPSVPTSKHPKLRSGPWRLVADPPPCDPGNPSRALAYCDKARHGQRCTCVFDLQTLGNDLEDLGLEDRSDAFEDELGPDDLDDLTSELLEEVRMQRGPAAARLQVELGLLRDLVREGAGVRPID
jgi:hypothetical protein